MSQYYQAFVKGELTKNDEQASSLGSRLRSYLTKEDPFRVRIDDDVMDQDQLGEVVAATEGFSGREIGKLMIAVQANLYGSNNGELSKDMVQTITKIKVDEHREKLRMAAGDYVIADGDGTLRVSKNGGYDDEAVSVKELVYAFENEDKTPDPQQARQAGRRALARAAASSSSSRTLSF